MVLVGMGMMGGRLVLVKGLFDSTVLLKNRGGMRLQLPRGAKGSGLRISPERKFRHGFPI